MFHVDIDGRNLQHPVSLAWLEEVALCLLQGIERSDAELSIVLCDDSSIAELNAQWRGKNAATDVLSFSQLENTGVELPFVPVMLGDVVISSEWAMRQADTGGWSIEFEMVRLLIHGLLHLLGHDHVQGGAEEARMQAEEKRLLALVKESFNLGICADIG